MKVLMFLALCEFNLQIHAASSESDLLCEGTDSKGQAITIKYDSWADNRNSARADVTIQTSETGPRTYVDLYVGGGDGDLSGADFVVSTGGWALEFYIYSAGESNQTVEAKYSYGTDEVVSLTCTETNF